MMLNIMLRKLPSLHGEVSVMNPNFFLMNVFFALKGSKLFIIITI